MVVKKIKIKAEFFDTFEAIAFLYITLLSIWMLLNNSIPKLLNIILLLIGVAGLIVGSIIVTKTYLIKR